MCIIRGSGGDQIVGDIYWDILYRTTAARVTETESDALLLLLQLHQHHGALLLCAVLELARE